MKLTFVSVALLCAAIEPVLSTIVVTKPVASTVSEGGKKLEVQWNDDGKAPKAKDWGKINVWLATGSHDTQYKLQHLGKDLKFTRTKAHWHINSNVGEDGNVYFLRFEGTNPSSSGALPMAFSSRFELKGMNGHFNETVHAANSGTTTVSSASSSMSTARTTSPSSSVDPSRDLSSQTDTSDAVMPVLGNFLLGSASALAIGMGAL